MTFPSFLTNPRFCSAACFVWTSAFGMNVCHVDVDWLQVQYRKLISGLRRSPQVEISEFAQSVIRARQREGHLPDVPVFGDITSFVPTSCGGEIGEATGMTGGFPCQAGCFCAVIDFVKHIHFRIINVCCPAHCFCQGICKAGGQRGLSDQRTALVAHIFRCMDDLAATLPFGLKVRGIGSQGLFEVMQKFACDTREIFVDSLDMFFGHVLCRFFGHVLEK